MEKMWPNHIFCQHSSLSSPMLPFLWAKCCQMPQNPAEKQCVQELCKWTSPLQNHPKNCFSSEAAWIKVLHLLLGLTAHIKAVRFWTTYPSDAWHSFLVPLLSSKPLPNTSWRRGRGPHPFPLRPKPPLDGFFGRCSQLIITTNNPKSKLFGNNRASRSIESINESSPVLQRLMAATFVGAKVQ